jgi:hypothetical protein
LAALQCAEARNPKGRRKNFQLFKKDPQHPSLHFERKKPELWSVRVGSGYRALARQVDDNLIWFWIGPHDEYVRLLREL